MTLYGPTDYPDGNGELWWLALEKIVAREQELYRDGTLWRLPTATVASTVTSRKSIGGYARSTKRRRVKWCAFSPIATTWTWLPSAAGSSWIGTRSARSLPTR
jgi:hypothetical protein